MLKATVHNASMPTRCCNASETRFQKGQNQWDQISFGFVETINTALCGEYAAGQFATSSSMEIVSGDHYWLVVDFTDRNTHYVFLIRSISIVLVITIFRNLPDSSLR